MKKIICLVFLVATTSAQAGVLSLTDFVTQEVDSMDYAFDELNRDVDGKPQEDYFFRRFWLRLRPKVGLTAAGFANLEIIPEIEMLWEKDTPDGWEIYKP